MVILILLASFIFHNILDKVQPSFEKDTQKNPPKPGKVISLLNNMTFHTEFKRVWTLEFNCLSSNPISTSY